MSSAIGILGGTFDPIHYGHLRTAFELWQELRLAEVRLLPAGTPPHRDQLYAAADVRLRMVRAAVAGQPYFVVDDREVRRTGPSYSVDTLTELRREYPERSLCLLLGMDAFLGLPQWHRWRELLTLAHVVVARAFAEFGIGQIVEPAADRRRGTATRPRSATATCSQPCATS